MQHFLEDNMWAKHVFAFLVLCFLNVLADPDAADDDILKVLLISALLYTWFILISKCTFQSTMAIMVIFFIVYLIQIRKRRVEDKDKERMQKLVLAQEVLLAVAVTITIYGFVTYMDLKKKEYKKNFKFMTFLLGKPICRRHD